MTDRSNRRRSQENALFLNFMCERYNYSDELVGLSFSNIDVEVRIAPDLPAETQIQPLPTLDEPTPVAVLQLSSEEYSDHEVPESSGSGTDIEYSASTTIEELDVDEPAPKEVLAGKISLNAQ
ncbi:hypothetical protein OUZ56_016330 [Daphnia magna]|uniref:Uncharacterized protein n=1 Tax=Daphnia magna TaxID=35525 RepID=A0ABR0AQH6_9CRUS|nr:hypothetical protein OUZ56_016330 [Daphnia magna]